MTTIKCTAKHRQIEYAVSPERLRLGSVIAAKIEDGTLFDAGIYRNAELAEVVREMVVACRNAVPEEFSLLNFISEQREFSARTFGPGERTEGVLKHIRKELDEVAADPKDVYEWIDVIILALDGAWRAGHSPDEIVVALQAKLARNKSRSWPDWRTAQPGEPIEHQAVAWCWASGLIEIGEHEPEDNKDGSGCIVIARGPYSKLTTALDVLARHGRGVDAGKLIVPGIPEEKDPERQLDALFDWLHQCTKSSAGNGVEWEVGHD